MNNQQQKCTKHNKEYTQVCLAQQCKIDFLMCEQCDATAHKHSKTQISQLQDIHKKLKSKWQPKDSAMDQYVKKSRLFYQNLKKQINKLIDQDQRTVQNILTKLKYHHLPIQANSSAYIQLIKGEYDKLDKNTISKLISQAENGEENKDMEKLKQISNFMDLELKKTNDKVLTLKYVLLSKKLQAEMLLPKLSQPSKVADHQQFTKIYSLFNSRKMLIRSIKLVFRASQYDFSASSFYNNCIDMHNCIAIAKGKNNKVYGGFSPAPLVYHDQQQLKQKEQDLYQKDDTKKSFIFSINNLKSYSIKDSQKAILYRKQAQGPSFGVDLQFGKVLKSNIGHSYESPQGIQVDSLQASVYLLQTATLQTQDFQIWQVSF